MADTQHYSTADYEERAQKVKRLLEYRNLLESLGIRKEEIDNNKIPDRDFTFLERMAQQKPYMPFNQTDNGNFPGKAVEYSPNLPRISGTYSKRFNEVYFPEIQKMREQYADMYRSQPELYHKPEKYYKNLDMTRVSFEPDDLDTHGSYQGRTDQIRLNSYSPYPFDTLVHENEHRKQHKYPEDKLMLEPEFEGNNFLDKNDLKKKWDQRDRFSGSMSKYLEELSKEIYRGRTGHGYTGQQEATEKAAEMRRLQSLQPYNTLPASPLEQGGYMMKPLVTKARR